MQQQSKLLGVFTLILARFRHKISPVFFHPSIRNYPLSSIFQGYEAESPQVKTTYFYENIMDDILK